MYRATNFYNTNKILNEILVLKGAKECKLTVKVINLKKILSQILNSKPSNISIAIHILIERHSPVSYTENNSQDCINYFYIVIPFFFASASKADPNAIPRHMPIGMPSARLWNRASPNNKPILIPKHI